MQSYKNKKSGFETSGQGASLIGLAKSIYYVLYNVLFRQPCYRPTCDMYQNTSWHYVHS